MAGPLHGHIGLRAEEEHMTRVVVTPALALVLVATTASSTLAGPIPDPPFRIAQASVQLGNFKLSDGDFSSLHAEAACCSAGPGHLGADARSSVDFGSSGALAVVHVEDFQPPPDPFLLFFPLAATAASDAHDVLTVSAGSRLLLSLLVDGAATAHGFPGGSVGGSLEVSVNGSNQTPSLPFNAGITRSLLTFAVPFTAGVSFGLDVGTLVEIRDFLSPDLHTDIFDESLDLSHTIRLVSTQVTDADGNPVDATIAAASGFDYANPLAGPPPEGGSVPEPPSSLLVAPGLILAHLTERWWKRKAQ
jgi:hypothetical protein